MGTWIHKIASGAIEYSFYALFFLTPLAISSTTSELFELNKMWLVFGLTILASCSFLIKAIIKGELRIQRTPLDVPIGLFFLSQLASTIFSWDKHISFWGYYTRFNGGLLSTVCFILLYYILVTVIQEKKGVLFTAHSPLMKTFLATSAVLLIPVSLLTASSLSLAGYTASSELLLGAGFISSLLLLVPVFSTSFGKRLLFLGLSSALIVALWGIPSHFGFDPTCLLFRGSFDVSCWTSAFQPETRIFSTLGQPNWLGAYLSILILLSLGFFISFATVSKAAFFDQPHNRKLLMTLFVAIASILYIALLYTRARSALLGVGVGMMLWGLLSFWVLKKTLPNVSSRNLRFLATPFVSIFTIFVILTILFGAPILNLDPILNRTQNVSNIRGSPSQTSTPVQALETGGTESGAIRLNVWKGALDIWKHYPLFGTGVETFAFAYYQFRPVEHNLTSEWDYLYNKAHNEYLNTLSTTGTVGMGAYLFMIGSVVWTSFKLINQANSRNTLIIAALFGGYGSILVSNFFGFSVVIINVFFFLIPALVLTLSQSLDTSYVFVLGKARRDFSTLSSSGGFLIGVIFIVGSFLTLLLWQFWQADKAYALGYNLARTGAYDSAHTKLKEAIRLRGDEPVFADELSSTDILLAGQLVRFSQTATGSAALEDVKLATTTAQQLAGEALEISNRLVSSYPRNLTFLKTRIRIFSTLAQFDARYASFAVEALEAARSLAPTDAKIAYSLGVAYGQNGNTGKAIKMLEETVKLRPMYEDAWYALGLFYHQASLNEKETIINQAMHQKGVKAMRQVLVLAPKNAKALEALGSWGEKI